LSTTRRAPPARADQGEIIDRDSGQQARCRLPVGPALLQPDERGIPERSLADADDLGVGRQNLFEQGRSRARHANHEHRLLGRRCMRASARDRVGIEAGDQCIDAAAQLRSVVGR
jgi:hypothetical protein